MILVHDQDRKLGQLRMKEREQMILRTKLKGLIYLIELM